jgi:DNA ligase 1
MNKSGLQEFAALVEKLNESTGTNDKLEALSHYFKTAPDPDKVWTIAIFSGRRPKRTVGSKLLQEWCAELIGLPQWLFEECYHTVGDLAETIALLLPKVDSVNNPTESLSYYIEKISGLVKSTEAEKKAFVIQQWQLQSVGERFVFNKLITGGFRIGVSQKMMVNALATTIQINPSIIALRISGNWNPSTITYQQLIVDANTEADDSKPYPFYLAHALEKEPDELGLPDEWQAEWKWDGIRGQLVKRNHQLFVWSRGEELMTDKFPEFSILEKILPNGLVLDGEIIPAKEGSPLPFALLQTRIGRKNITKKQLEASPICFFAYDILEWEGKDIREEPLHLRRTLLEKLFHSIASTETTSEFPLFISASIPFSRWDELAAIRNESREHCAEGLMLKRKKSTYQVGRKTGDWWKWKINALTIDAVLIYAQKGHGRRSNLYTDYTFALQDGDRLVSFTKAYSGLTDKEFLQVDDFVKKNGLEKFGPVRTVKPELVFEIAFEGIAASNRHKSGVALRFPRISRWRMDKKPSEINTLDDLKNMLTLYGK